MFTLVVNKSFIYTNKHCCDLDLMTHCSFARRCRPDSRRSGHTSDRPQYSAVGTTRTETPPSGRKLDNAMKHFDLRQT